MDQPEIPEIPIEKNPLPCFVCGVDLDHAAFTHEDGYQVNQPSGGTGFSSRGHYGSTVYDPMCDGEVLELAVCDECLKARWERTRELRRRKPRKPKGGSR